MNQGTTIIPESEICESNKFAVEEGISESQETRYSLISSLGDVHIGNKVDSVAVNDEIIEDMTTQKSVIGCYKVICTSMLDERINHEVKVNNNKIKYVREELILKTGEERIIITNNTEVLYDYNDSDKSVYYCGGKRYDKRMGDNCIGQGSFGTVNKIKLCEGKVSEDLMDGVGAPEESYDGVFGDVNRNTEKDQNLMAIKTFTYLDNGLAIQNCKNELKFMKILSHYHIIRFFDVYVDDCIIAIAMELMKYSLAYYISIKNNILPIEEIKKFSSDIFNGVRYMHSQNVCHRDLNSSNVLISMDDVAKISDFGTSVICDDLRQARFQDNFLLDNEFRAPEMIKHCGYSYKVDIWALGVILVHMGTGSVSDLKATPAGKDRRRASKSKSEELNQVINTCLQQLPAKRKDVTELHGYLFFEKTPEQETLN